MSSSTEKLSNVRKPRVHIKYEVETEGGLEVKDLPFVAGVMGDYSGNAPGEELKPLKDRKFINIDNDNFDQVMARQKPGLSFSVSDELSEGDVENEMKINLQFKSMDDFNPENVVDQIPALKELKDARDKLRDLLSKSDRSDKLEQILEDVLKNSDKLQTLKSNLEEKEAIVEAE
jgi:type VI secretion system protein ImpB